MKEPFAKAWWSFDLGKYRPCESTYQRYDYDSIPPLDEKRFDGTFSFLAKGKKNAAAEKRVAQVAKALREVGLELPEACTRFMSDPGLQGQINSCTACEFDLGEAPIPSKVVKGAYTVRFLRDQQDCLLWYLFLAPDGSARVIVSPIPFDDPDVDEEADVVIANTWECAPHFEHFIYRFWIENEIWDALNSKNPKLDAAQQRYVDHYRPN